MRTVRPPAVAGVFYPADPGQLRAEIDGLLAGAAPPPLDVALRMLIVPHAGYIFSGPVAATAYRVLRDEGLGSSRVALLGPSHFVAHDGIAISGDDGWRTPLGTTRLDRELAARLDRMSVVGVDTDAHADEHSLEVQLPFLQVVVPQLIVLPLLTGRVSVEDAADALDTVIEPGDVAAMISSDLSHYLDYDLAKARDGATARAIRELRHRDLRPADACGRTAVQAALLVAQRRGWGCRLLDLRNSGDTAGDRDRVVGYGAFALGPAR